MEAKLLCEFVQPRYPQQSVQASEAALASEDIMQEASASNVQKPQEDAKLMKTNTLE